MRSNSVANGFRLFAVTTAKSWNKGKIHRKPNDLDHCGAALRTTELTKRSKGFILDYVMDPPKAALPTGVFKGV